MLNEESVKQALQSVKYPGYSRDIVSFGLVKQIAVADGAVTVQIQLTSGAPEVSTQIKTEVERALRSLAGVSSVNVDVRAPAGGAAHAGGANPWAGQAKVPGIRPCRNDWDPAK